VIEPVYDLTAAADLDAALHDLRGYWKFWSACLLQKVSLPTLAGLILTRPDPQLHEQLHGFLKRIDARTVLIRHDVQNEVPPYPRGGFVVSERLLPYVLDFFFGLRRIVAAYEPADPLLNSYNLNLLFESAAEVLVEVVGPGFDASDLQRGDLSPHEVFSIVISGDGKVARLKRANGVDKKTYQESRQLRLKKIQRKFEQSPTPELARLIREDLKFPSTVEEYLEKLRSPLSQTELYVPISETLVAHTVTAIVNSGVIKLFQGETGVGFPLNFSTSLIDEGKRQVYWDIVSPKLKFQGLKQ